jgi:hypothetical protein
MVCSKMIMASFLETELWKYHKSRPNCAGYCTVSTSGMDLSKSPHIHNELFYLFHWDSYHRELPFFEKGHANDVGCRIRTISRWPLGL